MDSIKNTINVALADDHLLLRNALATLINSFGNCRVICQAGSGKELADSINKGINPDVVILDLNMPEMDGFETANWMQKKIVLMNNPDTHNADTNGQIVGVGSIAM